MEGGTIYGKSAEGGKVNSAPGAVLNIPPSGSGTAKWGTGGTYTKGGVSQAGGSDIGRTNDTLIVIPGK
jgi:hypothetical protein